MTSTFLSHSTTSLILQLSLSLSLAFILSLLQLPILILQNLHSYIHPDHIPQNNNNNNGIKAAIRRPSETQNLDLKKRSKSSKQKTDFDESNAQIFRIKLDGAHLVSRVFFKDYRDGFNFFFLAGFCILVNKFLVGFEQDLIFSGGSFVPVLLGLFCVLKLLSLLVKVCFEVSASRKIDKQLSVVLGIVVFVFGLVMMCSERVSWVFDFDFGVFDVFGRVLVAFMMGWVVGLLYMPARKVARTYWLGTDQVRCSLSIISCGWFARTVLYVNCVLSVFTALLWVNPFAKLLVNDNVGRVGGRVGVAETLVGNMGMSRSDFVSFRVWCLFLWGVLQIVGLRGNLQMFLNEAVLCWYQRLHASKVPDLDFSRAKVFLQNHYLCLAVTQFFAPPALVLILLGLSQVQGSPFKNFNMISNFLLSYDSVKEVSLFMAWWIVFVWATFTSVDLVLYRQGILYVS